MDVKRVESEFRWFDTMHIGHSISGRSDTTTRSCTGCIMLLYNCNDFMRHSRICGERWNRHLDRWMRTRIYIGRSHHNDIIRCGNIHHCHQVEYDVCFDNHVCIHHHCVSFQHSDVLHLACSYALAKSVLYLDRLYTFIYRLHPQKSQPQYQLFLWRYHSFHQWYWRIHVFSFKTVCICVSVVHVHKYMWMGMGTRNVISNTKSNVILSEYISES